MAIVKFYGTFIIMKLIKFLQTYRVEFCYWFCAIIFLIVL
jgi:hypothetical protein